MTDERYRMVLALFDAFRRHYVCRCVLDGKRLMVYIMTRCDDEAQARALCSAIKKMEQVFEEVQVVIQFGDAYYVRVKCTLEQIAFLLERVDYWKETNVKKNESN